MSRNNINEKEAIESDLEIKKDSIMLEKITDKIYNITFQFDSTVMSEVSVWIAATDTLAQTTQKKQYQIDTNRYKEPEVKIFQPGMNSIYSGSYINFDN